MKRRYEGNLSLSLDQFYLKINKNGQVTAWGNNELGQLGLGDIECQREPIILHSLKNIKKIVVDYLSVLFLDADGQVFACGSNSDGQLGIGDIDTQRTPIQLNSLKNIEQIISKHNSTFFIDTKGQVFACGSNERGRLGTWSTDEADDEIYPILIKSLEDIKQIVSDSHNTFFLNKKGQVFACGDNEGNKLEIEEADEDQQTPIQLTALKNIEEMTREGDYIYFRDSTGQMIAYGEDEKGQFRFRKDVQLLTNSDDMQILNGFSFFSSSSDRLVDEMKNCQISDENQINIFK